jgi:DNA-binding ferritin-like protein (Dps family)
MLIAEKKRKENISEYIIFMYQTEDLIRNYQFKLDEIEQYVISHFPVEDAEKKKITQWYTQVLETMKAEGLEKGGHLKEVQDLVDYLSGLNQELLMSDRTYRNLYDQAKLHINKHMSLAEGKITDPIQICLNGLYGLLLLRLSGKPVSEEQKQSLSSFGDVLSYLSYKYKQRKAIDS